MLVLLLLMMFGLYVLVLKELKLQCHQIFSLISVMLPHGDLEMFDFLFWFSVLHGEVSWLFLVSLGVSGGISNCLG